MSTSTTQATALAQPSKLSAYVSLTKPDVSFLVLMTTGAGYYMGVQGPVSWLKRRRSMEAVPITDARITTEPNTCGFTEMYWCRNPAPANT